MNRFWQNMNERERWMVSITLVVVVIYLFYMVIYSPLTTAAATKATQLSDKRDTLLWMQSINLQTHTGKSPEAITNSKLLTVIASQLRVKPLNTFSYQLQQTGAGDIQLSFEKVPYTYIMKWLWSLTNQFTVSLKQVNMERSETPGIIKAVVVMSTQ